MLNIKYDHQPDQVNKTSTDILLNALNALNTLILTISIVNPILNSGCSPTSVPPNVICLAPQNRVTVTLPLTLPPTYKYHTSPDHIHPADIMW